MKRTMTVTAVSLFMVLLAMAQNAQQTPKTESQSKSTAGSIPTLDQILDKYVLAVGGKVAVEKLTSRVIKGSLVVPGGSAPLQIFEKNQTSSW